MSQFCLECGQQANNEDLICTNCGTKLPQKPVTPQQPLSTKKKIIYGLITTIAVLLIGFTVWANGHFSEDTTTKRFADALSTKDVKVLQSLVVHEDGSAISQQEVTALLALVKSDGKKIVESFISIQQDGKWLGVFDNYKVQVVDQYAYFDGPVEGLLFTFNGVEMREEKRKEDSILYGPLAPGIYDVKIKLEGKYGEGTGKGKLYATSFSSNDPSWIQVEMPLGTIVFDITNYSSEVMKDVYISINDEKIPVDDYGQTEAIGPVLLDGSQHAKVVVQYPWGEVTSEEIAIETDYQEIAVDILTQEEFDKVVVTLKQYGEEYIEAKAKRSTSVFSTTTKSFNESFQEDVIEGWLMNNNLFVTGKFEQLGVNDNSVYLLDDPDQGITMQATFQFMDDEHSLTETPSLDDSLYQLNVDLIYSKDEQNWLINQSPSIRTSSITATATFPGSGTIHQPSSDTVQAEKDRILNDELQTFMEYYVSQSVYAINSRDFSYIEHLMTDNGPRKKEAKDYIAYLETKGITEQYIDVTVEKVEAAGANTWKVTTTDEFIIFYPDNSKQNKYTTSVIVKNVDGNWLVHELISTEEI